MQKLFLDHQKIMRMMFLRGGNVLVRVSNSVKRLLDVIFRDLIERS